MLLLKLPVYAVALQYAVSVRGINAFALVAGLALVPAVMALKAAGRAMLGDVGRSSSAEGFQSADNGASDAPEARA
jgi:hypothetical protein